MLNQDALAKRIPDYASVIQEVFSFAGGVNTRASQLFLSKDAPYALKPDQITIGDNVIRTKSGGLETRPGRVKINSSAVVPPAGDSVIRSMYELRRTDGTNKICMNAGNTFYYLNGSTWTSVGTFVTANLRRSYCQYKEVLLGVDGTNDMCKYDGTTLSTIAAAPKGSVMAAHRNRVFIGNGKDLAYCAIGDETDWTTPNNAGSIPVPITKGKGISGLIPLWDRLIIFAYEQVFQLVGTAPSDFEVQPINLAYGHSGSPYGVCAAGNDVYFADAKGVHSLSVSEAQSITGDVSYSYASALIEPSWQAINPANLPNIFALHDKQRNLLLFFNSVGSTNNDSAWAGDYYHLSPQEQPTWTSYSSMPFSCGCEVTSLNGYNELLFGDYTGTVYRQTTAEDDAGTAIAGIIQYVTDCELPQFTKLLRHFVGFYASNGGPLNITVSYDFGLKIFNGILNATSAAGDTIGGTFVVGVSPIGTRAYSQSRVSIPGHGRFIVINITFSTTKRVSFGGFMLLGGIRRLLNF